eukprot:15364599-Ditylum_brightwellii.AAC.7
MTLKVTQGQNTMPNFESSVLHCRALLSIGPAVGSILVSVVVVGGMRNWHHRRGDCSAHNVHHNTSLLSCN